MVWYPPGTDANPQRLDSGEGLARVRQLAAQPQGRLCFAVPGTDVSLLSVEFSAAEKKHIHKALPFTLEEQLISDIEQLHFSTEMTGKNSLCVALCSSEKMHAWQAALADLPTVKHWVAEPQLLPWRAGEWTVVLETSYAIVRTGDCEGFSIERILLPSVLQAALEGSAEAPQAVIVYGQDQRSDQALLPESLRERMQWRLGDFRAALLLSQEDNVAVNLLQGDFARKLPLNRWWQQWQSVAAVFALAFCLQLVATYSSYLALERENLALRQEIESTYRRAFPRGALVDAEKQVKRQLDSLRGTAQASGFVSLMDRVGKIVASKPGTHIDSINYSDKGGEMRMNITASDFEAVEAVRTAMTKNGLNAVMENSNAQGERVRARLRVGEKS
jgi:type II secretion system protein L